MDQRRFIPIDKGWTFREASVNTSKFLPVSQFPTCIHLDLIHHGIIQDPFTGTAEKQVQWVGERAWVYRTAFVTPQLGEDEKAVLAFDGLDTYASVHLNGKEILETENMFIPGRVNITSLLRGSNDQCNVLEITFDSAFTRGKEEQKKYPNHRWGCWNGDPSRLAVRKAQYHYGWDWGPVLLTCGPWRPITLEVYSARIADLYYTTKFKGCLKEAEISITADVEGRASEVVFSLSLDTQEQDAGNQFVVTAKVKDGKAAATIHLKNPQLWYPARYGSQPLYSLKAKLVYKDVALDSRCKRIGLRKVELVQRQLEGSKGTTFLFELNNLPIFCGGSNWIPADSFIPRISAQRYRDWLKMAVDGNQVMLRVWAGGIYEQDAFYEACDEYGLLVWQDFMFACGNYPAHKSFLKSVEQEAVANVKRLRHHPSIVIWAGNNEDYSYRESEKLEYNPADKDPRSWLKTNFPARYIYEKLLVDVIKRLTPDTHYHYGSPSGGAVSTDPTAGDIHQWNVWHGTQEKYQDFDKLSGRFVSEFGMQGLPSIETIDSMLPRGNDDKDRYPNSFTLDYHNKAAGHERRLATYLVENIRYTFNPLEQYVHCTQVMQAECVSTAYRLWKRQWKGRGKEYCAGVLVWQLNDCWPVISWSIADYSLRPKHAYFAIKRELAPVTVSMKRAIQEATLDDPTPGAFMIELWATNLTLEPCTVKVQIRAWDIITGKQTYLANVREEATLPANQATELEKLEIPEATKGSRASSQTVVAAYLIHGGKQIARYVNWPEPLKYINFQSPQAPKLEVSEDKRHLRLSAEVPVKGLAVFSSADDVVFDDNCVDLVPGETVSIGVRGLKSGNVEGLTLRYLH
ncbi:beta-mannosidase [Arthroderma uncinatum]|uniref:beta-mannosidase n=1 Tax=Arthroderma uncinatum TaxID=74035 RepID=UPI00144A6761|nr:beta-mannosidase [Arthroderma uncinatum]KAF3492174.1 beta-mannosidase [Arthroderma uncinatum]